MLPKSYVRWMLYYVDWASHYFNIFDMTMEDKLRLVMARFIPISHHFHAYKQKTTEDKYYLFGSGTYINLEKDSLRTQMMPTW